MLKLDFNERCEGTPFWAAQAMQQMNLNELWRYPDRTPLEQTIATSFNVSASQVLITNGGDEGIDLILRLAKRERRKLLLPLPAFSMYSVTAARNELGVETVAPQPGLRLDFEALIEPLQATGKILALTSPNNPTGETISREKLIVLITQARAFGNPVLLDEAYAEFAGSSAVDLIEKFDNLIVLRSFSKAFGLAGLRVGYLIAQEALLQKLRALAPPFNVSTPSLILAQAACANAPQTEMKSYCTQIAQARDGLRAELIGAGFDVIASQGNFLLLPLGVRRAQMVASYLKRQGISVREFREAELAGCLRITIPLNIDALKTALMTALSPELLCLDMDGVLIDTKLSYDACVKATVVQLGGKEPSQETLKSFRNKGGFNDDWALTAAILREQGVVKDYEDIKATFQSLYLGSAQSQGLRAKEKALPSEATRQRLAALPYAIVTGRPRDEAEDGTRFCQLNPLSIVSRDDVKNGKPDPEGIIQLRRAQKAERVWMVGDSVDDIQAALGACAIAIGIGLENSEALLAAGADIVLPDINAVTELLGA